MSSFAQLVLDADTRGLKKGVDVLDQVDAAGAKAEQSTDKAGRAFVGAGSAAGAAAPKVRQFEAATHATRAVAVAAAQALGAMAAGFVSFQAIGGAISLARGFSAAIAETSTLIKGTPQELDQLSAAAKGLAAQFGGSATAQVEAFYQAISAGAAGVSEAQVVLESANKLAIGGATDVTTAVGILSGVINSYGADAISAAEVSDSLFIGMKAGVTTVGELSASLGQVIPTAKALGISFDETVAATAALTKNNLSTSAAVTSLNAALVGVIKPTAEASKLAQQLGINFSAAGIKAKGLGGFLAEIADKTHGNVDQMAQLFGSVEALKAALLFAGEAGGQYAVILEQMGVKAGATDEAFAKMAGNFDFRLSKLTASMQNMGIVAGNALLTVLVPAAEALSAGFTFLADKGDILAVGLGTMAAVWTASLLPAMAASVLAMGANAVALGSLIAEFGVATVAAELFGLAFMASNPIGWAVGLGVATAAIYAWAGSSDNAAKAAGIQTAAAEQLRAALDGVNTVSAEGKIKANELAEATITAARADVLAARIKMANSQAELQMNGGFAFAAAAQKAREEMERTQAVLAGLIAEADRLGLVISKTPSELAAAGGKVVDLSQLLAIAAGEAQGIATAVGSINMDGAIGQASALASSLGVPLEVALKLNAVLNANAGISTKAGTARQGPSLGFGGVGSALPAGLGGAGVTFNSSPDVRIANQQAAAIANWKPPVIKGGGGGGGGASEIRKTTEALKAEILALEQVANPMLKYNEGLAHLNALKKAGLSEKGYAAGIAKLKEEMQSATPAANALTSALTDGIGQAVDWMVSGFKGGLKGLLNIFKSTIMQMISYALKNKIMIALGIGGGGGVGSIASAATGGAGAGGGLLSSLTGGAGILGSLGSGLFGASPVLGTGLLGGLGSTLSATFGAGGGIGGLFGIGANAAAAGGGLMAGLGAALPVIGIIAGVFSFFKTKTKLLDEGIRGTISMESAMFDSYQKIEKSRFWGLSKKTSFKYTALGADASAPMVAAAKATQDAVLNSAEALGFAASTFQGFSYKFQLSLKGLDDAAKQAKVIEALTGLSDAMAGMVAGVGAFKIEGEGAAATLSRLASNLVSVNDVFRDLGFGLEAVSLAGADAAYKFAQVFGGLDQMASATGAYYQAFYSDQERLANATSRLGEQLLALGVNAIPTTYEAYRMLVDQAMASGDQILGANLIQIASLFDQVKQAEQSLADQRLASLNILEDRFTNAFDYRRAQSRAGNGTEISATDTGVTSPETLELLKAIASSLAIIAADTARNVNAAEDLLAVTLGGVTA